MSQRRRPPKKFRAKLTRALAISLASYAALAAASLTIMWQTPRTVPLFQSTVGLSNNQQLTPVFFSDDDPANLWETREMPRTQIKPDRLWADDDDWLRLSHTERHDRLENAREARSEQFPDTRVTTRGPSPLTRPLQVDGSPAPALSVTESPARLADGSFLPPDIHIPTQSPLVQQWLARGEIPGQHCEPLLASLGLSAMSDLAVMGPATWGDDIPLTFSDGDPIRAVDGAIPAGWHPNWRYVWPRDASTAAAALAGTGHSDDAARILSFLAQVQRADGSFAPRYLTDGSGLPWDMRRDQADAPGWTLWAITRLAEADPSALTSHIRDMARRSYGRILSTIIDTDGSHDAAPAGGEPLTPASASAPAPDHAPPAVRIPEPSSDFTEVKESSTPLSIPLANLMGLRAAERLRALDHDFAHTLTPAAIAHFWLSSGEKSRGEETEIILTDDNATYHDPHTRPATPPWAVRIPARYLPPADATGSLTDSAAGADRLADDFQALITTHYGPEYHRYSPDPWYDRLRGRTGPDVALALAGPPFNTYPLAGAQQIQGTLWERLARAGGGLAPTSAWTRDGVSWTPATLWMGLSAAGSGDYQRGVDTLRWAAHNRTAAGSLPEKVLANGNPAAVSPLTWSAALAVLTLLELGENCS